MNSRQREQEPQVHLELGNYRQAQEIYKELAENESDLSSKNHFNDSAKAAEAFATEFTGLRVGEALCPIVDKRTGHGCLCVVQTGRVRDLHGRLVSQSIGTSFELFPQLMLNWTPVTELIATFLSPLVSSFGRLSVLNWGWDCWKPSVRKLPHRPNERAKDPQGESSQLAMALAILSEITSRPIGAGFAFTGKLVMDGGRVCIERIEDVAEKVRVSLKELPDVRTIFVPHSNEREALNEARQLGKDAQIGAVSTLEEVIEVVFPSFNDDFLRMVADRHLGSDWLYLDLRENSEHVLQFESLRNGSAFVDHKTIGSIQLPSLPDGTRGLILNGPLPIFLTSTLTPRYIRHYQIFFAVSLGKDRKDAVVTAGHAHAPRQVGDVVSFEPSPERD